MTPIPTEFLKVVAFVGAVFLILLVIVSIFSVIEHVTVIITCHKYGYQKVIVADDGQLWCMSDRNGTLTVIPVNALITADRTAHK